MSSSKSFTIDLATALQHLLPPSPPSAPTSSDPDLSSIATQLPINLTLNYTPGESSYMPPEDSPPNTSSADPPSPPPLPTPPPQPPGLHSVLPHSTFPPSQGASPSHVTAPFFTTSAEYAPTSQSSSSSPTTPARPPPQLPSSSSPNVAPMDFTPSKDVSPSTSSTPANTSSSQRQYRERPEPPLGTAPGIEHKTFFTITEDLIEDEGEIVIPSLRPAPPPRPDLTKGNKGKGKERVLSATASTGRVNPKKENEGKKDKSEGRDNTREVRPSRRTYLDESELLIPGMETRFSNKGKKKSLMGTLKGLGKRSPSIAGESSSKGKGKATSNTSDTGCGSCVSFQRHRFRS